MDLNILEGFRFDLACPDNNSVTGASFRESGYAIAQPNIVTWQPSTSRRPDDINSPPREHRTSRRSRWSVATIRERAPLAEWRNGGREEKTKEKNKTGTLPSLLPVTAVSPKGRDREKPGEMDVREEGVESGTGGNSRERDEEESSGGRDG